MNDERLLERLSRTDAYAPDIAMPPAAWTPDAAYEEIESRIDGQSWGSPSPGAPSRRTGLMIASVVFVIALLGGTALLTSRGSGPDLEPATTITPTTTLAPATTTVPTTTTTTNAQAASGAAVAYFEALSAEVNSGNGEAAAQRVLGVESFDGLWFEGSDGYYDERPLLASHLRLWSALGSVMTVDECSDLTSGVARCVLSRTSEHDAFHPSAIRTVWQIRFEGDVVAFMKYDADLSDPAWRIQIQYEQWLSNANRSAFNTLIAIDDPLAAAEVQREFVARWRSEQGSG